MAVDLDIGLAQREGTQEWEIAAPANTSSYTVVVPYDPAEWAVPRTLTIDVFDGSGHFLGASTNTRAAIDKVTGLPRDFFLDIILGIEREDRFPPGFRAGRTTVLDGVRYRQILIDTPLTVRVTVDAPTTYGVQVTLDSRDARLQA